MSLETETIDRLFLELSQFTGAKTWREIALEAERDQMGAVNGKYGLALMMIREGCSDPAGVARKALLPSPPQKDEAR